jgi:hypothetical protein
MHLEKYFGDGHNDTMPTKTTVLKGKERII